MTLSIVISSCYLHTSDSHWECSLRAAVRDVNLKQTEWHDCDLNTMSKLPQLKGWQILSLSDFVKDILLYIDIL